MTIFASIEWPQISALAACAGVIVTMIYNIKNMGSTWLSNSSRMVLELSAAFNSEEMRKHRTRLAKQLLKERSTVNLHHDNPVLGFLEEIGYMTRRGVLDRGMVWNSFFWSLERYYLSLTRDPNLLLQARSEARSKTIYREIEWLYTELCKVSLKEKGVREYIPPPEGDIRLFLDNESVLISTP